MEEKQIPLPGAQIVEVERGAEKAINLEREARTRKLLRRRFSMVGWTLVGYYIVMNLLVVLALVADAAAQMGAGELDMAALMNNGWGYLAAVAVGLTVLYGWKGPDYLRDTVGRKSGSMRPGAFLAFLSLCIGAQLINSAWVWALEWVMNRFDRSVMDLLESVSGQTDSFSMFLYASILAPVSEEIIFRGFVLRTLEPFGKRFAIFASALLFGLFHGNLLQTPYAFLMGLALGYIATEYSVFWSMGVHLFNNLVLADLLTRLERVLPTLGQNALELALVLVGAASVVVLIRNRAALRAWRGEKMDSRCLRCFFSNFGVIALILLTLLSIVTLL